MRPTLVEVHIADLHFGAFDPSTQYNILMDQFINKIRPLAYDIISINGDIFDHKFMANSDAIRYAMAFVDTVIKDALFKGADVILLYGTESHDSGQFKLFYQYFDIPTVHIVETVQFLEIKGKRILAIPEKYGLPKEEYEKVLFYSGLYDGVVMHGTYKGSVYGMNTPTIDCNHAPVFDIRHFMYCQGPIIAGHVHIPGCYDKHVYYCGSPLRYKFGEEEEKGFIVLTHNLETQQYYIHFEPIYSYRYDTINMDEYLGRDPKELIEKINYLRANGIHFLRVEFTRTDENLFNVIESYYRNTSAVSFKIPDVEKEKLIQAQVEQSNKYNNYQYVFDKSLSPEQILTRYINQQKGYQYLTVDELQQILKGFA